MRENLGDNAFTTIKAQESVNVDFDIAELHDLSSGGDFTIVAQGLIPYAKDNSNEISETISFSSNILNINVDGTQAARVRAEIDRAMRTTVNTTCTGTDLTVANSALENCAKLASAAAASTNLTKYDPSVLDLVS